MPRSRTNRKKASGGGSKPSAGQSGGGGPAVADPPVGEDNQAGAREWWIVNRDPKTIYVPEGYVESAYNQERRENLGRNLQESGQRTSINTMIIEDGRPTLFGGKHRLEDAIAKGIDLIRCEETDGTLEEVLDANGDSAFNQSQPSLMSVINGIGYRFHVMGWPLERTARGHTMAWLEDHLRIFDACQLSRPMEEYIEDGILLVGKAGLLAKALSDGSVDLDGMEQLLRQLMHYGWTEAELAAEIRGDNDPPESPGRPSSGRQTPERKPVVCSHCGVEQEASQATTLTLCPDCINRRKLGQDQAVTIGPDQVAVPRKWVRESIQIMAGRQDGAMQAEQGERYLEVGS